MGWLGNTPTLTKVTVSQYWVAALLLRYYKEGVPQPGTG